MIFTFLLFGDIHVLYFITVEYYLNPFGLLLKYTIDWVAFTQQKFISNSSGGWEVQDQGTSRFGFW